MTIDWSGIKTAAIALGNVQDAARRASNTLPAIEQQRFIERVNKRAVRERWMHNANSLAITATERNSKPMSNNVQSGADSIANVIAERKHKTRLHLSKYAEEAAEESANSTNKLKISKSVRDVAAIMSNVWPESTGTVHIGSLSMGILTNQAAIQLNTPNEE